MRIHDESLANSWMGPGFRPHPLLRSSHLMSIVPGFLPRPLRRFARGGKRRIFKIDEKTSLLGYCHFRDGADSDNPTVLLLHGLEGSSESSHVLGIGYKAFMNGFNVVRLNMRNCGGSMDYAESLYHAGLYADPLKVIETLLGERPNSKFILCGYSLGGNLLLNSAIAAGSSQCETERGQSSGFKSENSILAVCTVSPCIDLAAAVDTIEKPENQIYQNWFLRTMKQKITEKAKQQRRSFDISSMKSIKTIREFDDRFTAPDGGYGTAERYYFEASAKSRLKDINIPCLIIASKDDPLVPFESFATLDISNDMIELLITSEGGHGGFFQESQEEEDHFDQFWAENRVVAYIREVSSRAKNGT